MLSEMMLFLASRSQSQKL